jgi:aspartyl-tRNA(Asn)/glutamyl-tRNA(Gln) amidotransferase subunit A
MKDNIETAGIRTTAASAVLENNIPTRDAESVRRLKQAGAILLGKLNMHEFACGGTSVISHYGPVRNPWNPAYIAGGSSGGSGSATAARMFYFALGTDSGGSVRQPAAYCGVVGLQPTYGRVSTHGIIAGEWSTDQIGPLTCTVADSAIALQALAGYNPDDPYSANQPVPPYSEVGEPRKLRIGIPRRQFYTNIHPELAAATDHAITLLSRLGAGTTDVDLPAAEPILRSLEAEGYSFHQPYLKTYADLYYPSARS